MFKLQAYILICFVAALSTCEASYVSEMRLPFIVDPIEDKSIVLDQNAYNVEIPCKAFGNPTPTVSWYKNNVLLPKDSMFIKIMATGNLLVNRFSSNDNGYYSCTASNKWGTSVSHRVRIRSLTSLGIVHVNDREVQTAEAAALVLTCGGVAKIDFMNYTVVKQWYLNTEPIVPTRRVGIDTEGTLYIAHVSRADCGEYRCRMAPLVARPNSLIIDIVKADFRLFPGVIYGTNDPELQSNNAPKKIFARETLILDCFFSAKPTPQVTWYDKDGAILRNGDRSGRITFRQDGKQLVIFNVRQEDEQVYHCDAASYKNGKNYISSCSEIEVNVTGPPRSAHGRKLMTKIACKGKDVTLRCDAKGVSDENVDTPIWYRNGQVLNTSNFPAKSRYSFNKNMTALTIQNVVSVDEANYQCKVSNSEGFAFIDGYVLVPQHKSITLTKKPEDYLYAVSYGDVIDITIRAGGNACNTVTKTWFHLGLKINVSTFLVFQIDKEKDTMLFNTSRVKQKDLNQYMGDYECQLSDGNFTAQILLRFTTGEMIAKALSGCDGLARLDAAILSLSTLVLICLHSLY